jgi:hypothetical protein
MQWNQEASIAAFAIVVIVTFVAIKPQKSMKRGQGRNSERLRYCLVVNALQAEDRYGSGWRPKALLTCQPAMSKLRRDPAAGVCAPIRYTASVGREDEMELSLSRFAVATGIGIAVGALLGLWIGAWMLDGMPFGIGDRSRAWHRRGCP